MSCRTADVAVPQRCSEMIRAGALAAISTRGGEHSQAMTILQSCFQTSPTESPKLPASSST